MDIASLREEYKRNGAVCLRGFLSQEWLSLAEQGVEAVFQHRSQTAQLQPYRNGQGTLFRDCGNWKNQPALKEFIFKSPIAAMVAQILDCKTVTLYHERVTVKDPRDLSLTPFAQEITNYPFAGNQGCSAFAPLDKICLESTPKFVLGSHLWGKTYYPLSFDADQTNETGSVAGEFEQVPNVGAMKDATINEWNLYPGDVVLYNMNTLVACNGNATGEVKRGIITHWFGDDIKFVERLWPISPRITGKLKVGEHPSKDSDTFPVVYPEATVS